jgi:hypothetical protein
MSSRPRSVLLGPGRSGRMRRPPWWRWSPGVLRLWVGVRGSDSARHRRPRGRLHRRRAVHGVPCHAFWVVKPAPPRMFGPVQTAGLGVGFPPLQIQLRRLVGRCVGKAGITHRKPHEPLGRSGVGGIEQRCRPQRLHTDRPSDGCRNRRPASQLPQPTTRMLSRFTVLGLHPRIDRRHYRILPS